MSEDDLDLLNALPLELQLYIADAVGERCDRASLALASPRLLGLAACRQLPSYQGLEMSLAFHYVLGGAIDEQLLRTYASRSMATAEGCGWLTGVATALRTETRIRVEVVSDTEHWYLMQPGSVVGALLREGWPVRGAKGGRAANHYEGEEGAEHLVVVCFAGPRGGMNYYDGEQGAERLVRVEHPMRRGGSRGGVDHYKGEKGTERLVRCEHPSGKVQHYKGEQGAEHYVRWVTPDGNVLYYKGETDKERLVRWELPNGRVCYYKGESGFERVVRVGTYTPRGHSLRWVTPLESE